MVVVDAFVEEIDGKYYIKIVGDTDISIPLTEDDPNQVKKSFNKLILRLKKGVFSIELKGVEESLIHQVSKEYLAQLNKELSEVYGEMEQHDLIDT